MRRLQTVLTLTATMWAATLPVAGTSPQQSFDPRSAVRAGTGITYLDLLRRVFPDATYDATKQEVRAHKSVAIRNIADGHQPTALQSDITLSYLSPRWIKSDGRPVLLLAINVAAEDANEATPYEGETMILGAFDVETSTRLIDALEVQTDRFTSLWDTQPVVHLSSDHDALVVHNTHWNAGESYDQYTLVFLGNGTFGVISDITLYSTLGCGTNYTETPDYAAVQHAGRAYPDVRLLVTLKKMSDGDECDHRTAGFTRTYTATYTWDAKKREYIGNLRGLDALDRFNRQRIGWPQ